MECIICKLETTDNLLVKIKKGLRTISECSKLKNYDIWREILDKYFVYVHENCRKLYTRIRSTNSSNRGDQPSTSKTLRSTAIHFNFKENCLFCAKPSKGKKGKNILHQVTTLEFKTTIIERYVNFRKISGQMKC